MFASSSTFVVATTTATIVTRVNIDIERYVCVVAVLAVPFSSLRQKSAVKRKKSACSFWYLLRVSVVLVLSGAPTLVLSRHAEFLDSSPGNRNLGNRARRRRRR